jgi:hypothetical protein
MERQYSISFNLLYPDYRYLVWCLSEARILDQTGHAGHQAERQESPQALLQPPQF